MRTNINKCCIPLKTLIHDNVLFEVTRPTFWDVIEEAACDLVSSYKTFFCVNSNAAKEAEGIIPVKFLYHASRIFVNKREPME
jgi:hypothetical protein